MNTSIQGQENSLAPDSLRVQFGRTQDAAPYELLLLQRVSDVKAVAAILNFGAILVAQRIPTSPSAISDGMPAYTVAAIFLLYVLVARTAIKSALVSHRTYTIATPLLDVVFIALLVLGTGGHQSPFNYWFLFAAVTPSFGSLRRLTAPVAIFAACVQLLVTFVPQVEASGLAAPVDWSLLLARLTLIFAFTAMLIPLGADIVRQHRVHLTGENLNREMASASSSKETVDLYFRWLHEVIGAEGARVELESGEDFSVGSSIGEQLEVPIESGGYRLGKLRVSKGSRRWVRDETHILNAATERLAANLRRLQLAQALQSSAAQEERLRLADELHDTHIQTLAAIDLEVEAVMSKDEADTESLLQIRRLSREGAAKLRGFIAKGDIEFASTAAELKAVVESRWKGNLEFNMPSHLELTRSVWQAVAVMVREGIANARTHGNADWIGVYVEEQPGIIVARIESNGASPKLPLPAFGYGLHRAATAVAGAGGHMFFEPRPESGAILVGVFPKRQT